MYRGSLIIALACGALVTAALPPLLIWPLLLGIVPVFALIAGSRQNRDAFWIGFTFAIGLFVTHVIWLPVSLGPYSGGLFWVLFPPMLVILGCFWGLTAYVCRRLGGRGSGALVLLPPVWVVVEWLRSVGTFAFPWGLFGYAWLDAPTAGLASVGGVYLLSLITTTGAALLAAPLTRWLLGKPLSAWQRAAPVALACVLLLLSAAAGARLLEPPASDERRTALLVQGATDPFGRAAGIETDLEVYVRLTEEALDTENASPDLVVWPEAVVMDLDLSRAGSDAVRARIAEATGNAVTVTGGSAWTEHLQRTYNSVYSMDGPEVLSRYDKAYLVPFGESAPFEDLLRPVYRAAFGWFGLAFAGGREPGTKIQPLATPFGEVAAYICYESVFPQVPRNMVNSGAKLLINISNDAWFGLGHGAEQHFDMGRMRAIETGRYLLRVGNDGITALIDPTGRVTDRLPRGPEGALSVEFGMLTQETLYVRYGGLLPALLLGLCAALTLALRVNRLA